MKTAFYSFLALLIFLSSCDFKKKTEGKTVNFGLYETVRITDLPVSLFDSIRITNIQPQYDKGLPIVGYLTNEDFEKFESEFSRSSIRFLKTFNPVDPENKYYAIVAVKYPSVINNADIQRVKHAKQDVNLYFNHSGAIKWAAMTKNNIGKMVALVIDDQVYNMPKVEAEIKNGTAVINGFPDQKSAKKAHDALNQSINRQQ